jgi:hypothetical protein
MFQATDFWKPVAVVEVAEVVDAVPEFLELGAWDVAGEVTALLSVTGCGGQS